ncbi:MAG: L,D-transpeptidase family protein [Anaerolineae bacterium]|nr:L,D-transpeptidase family protein [Anaerolineae bacterium]
MNTKLREKSQTLLTSVIWLLLGVLVLLALLWAVKLGQLLPTILVPAEADAAAQATVALPAEDVAAVTPTWPAMTPVIPTAAVVSTAAPTATPVPTATPAGMTGPHISTAQNTVNVRQGPGTAYDRLGLLAPNSEAQVTGWNGAWWQVTYNGTPGFVSGDVVIAYEINGVPEVAAPPLPTPTPTTIAPTPTPIVVTPPLTLTTGRWIDVDLSDQRLFAYEGQTLINTYLISSGLPQTPTPTGQFYIWIKLRTDDMSGPGYDIKGVPWVMYFLGGYGLHGVTWHGNFGHPMSHGCINQPTDMAEWLFNFAEVGTLVNIHE